MLAMRFRFVQWPLHPLALCVCTYPSMDFLWLTLFLAWLVKALILRYGGIKAYQRLRPGFLGLICGYYVSTTMWTLIDHFTGTIGNMVDLYSSG